MLLGLSRCTAQTLLAYWRAIPIKKLGETEEGSNPNRFTVSEISQKKAGVSHETVHRLLLLHSRRLDLLGDVLADRLPLYKAIIKMRAGPEKWENRPRSRL